MERKIKFQIFINLEINIYTRAAVEVAGLVTSNLVLCLLYILTFVK